jgi:putative transposase
MMLPKWVLPLFVMLQELCSARRNVHIKFLKLQVELLKKRLPGNRVVLDPTERKLLMRIGAKLDHQAEDTLGIVTVKLKYAGSVVCACF